MLPPASRGRTQNQPANIHKMPIASLSAWNQFLLVHPNVHLLQTGEWGELKSAFGWKPVRLVSGEDGVQILFRKLPLGFTVGYIPKFPARPDRPGVARQAARRGADAADYRSSPPPALAWPGRP